MPRPPTGSHPEDLRRISDLSGLSLQPRLNSQNNKGVQDQYMISITTTNSANSSSRFRTTPCSDSDIHISQPVIKQGERPVLIKDLQKLCELASSKLTNCLCLLTFDEHKSQFANTYDTTMRVAELKHRLMKQDMIDVFQLRSAYTSESRDVLSLFFSISGDQVCASNRFYNRLGYGFDLQNLTQFTEIL